MNIKMADTDDHDKKDKDIDDVDNGKEDNKEMGRI